MKPLILRLAYILDSPWLMANKAGFEFIAAIIPRSLIATKLVLQVGSPFGLLVLLS